MNFIRIFIINACCFFVATTMFPFCSSATDFESVAEVAKNETMISKSIPIENNIDVKTAYSMTIKNNVPVVDVRTIQEYQFVGHINSAYNIPVQVWSENWDNKKNIFFLDQNPYFITNFLRKFPNKRGTYIIYCQSGHRSIKAIELLVKEGYTNLYNMMEGFDGISPKGNNLSTINQKYSDESENNDFSCTKNIDKKLISSKS